MKLSDLIAALQKMDPDATFWFCDDTQIVITSQGISKTYYFSYTANTLLEVPA